MAEFFVCLGNKSCFTEVSVHRFAAQLSWFDCCLGRLSSGGGTVSAGFLFRHFHSCLIKFCFCEWISDDGHAAVRTAGDRSALHTLLWVRSSTFLCFFRVLTGLHIGLLIYLKIDFSREFKMSELLFFLFLFWPIAAGFSSDLCILSFYSTINFSVQPLASVPCMSIPRWTDWDQACLFLQFVVPSHPSLL